MNFENVEYLIKRAVAEGESICLLESQDVKHNIENTSFLAIGVQAEIRSKGLYIFHTESGTDSAVSSNPWDGLNSFYTAHKNDWLFGYLGYDLKNFSEDLISKNPDLIDAPDSYFFVPKILLKQAGANSEWKLIKGTLPEKDFGHLPACEKTRPKLAFICDKETYLGAIHKARDYIKEGDCYEINLSHQMIWEAENSGFEIYKKMKTAGAVPFGAYFHIPGLDVCCASPERFLKIKNGIITSQPIKGTQAVGRPGDTEAEKKMLYNSEKNKAENLMIVDLVRNDLARVSEKGSVRVPALFEIQSFKTVHQLVSTISAKALPHLSPFQIIEKCFPMGSMTGAPKISAMRLIDELEWYKRGLYSGTMGYISPDGDADFNVLIRTAILKEGKVYYSAGGAITADSVPEEEWEETLVKTKILQNAFNLF